MNPGDEESRRKSDKSRQQVGLERDFSSRYDIDTHEFFMDNEVTIERTCLALLEVLMIATGPPPFWRQ
jgi:hypothetical protein